MIWLEYDFEFKKIGSPSHTFSQIEQLYLVKSGVWLPGYDFENQFRNWFLFLT